MAEGTRTGTELIRLVIESECIEALSPDQVKTRYTEEEGGMGGRRDRDRAYHACNSPLTKPRPGTRRNL